MVEKKEKVSFRNQIKMGTQEICEAAIKWLDSSINFTSHNINI